MALAAVLLVSRGSPAAAQTAADLFGSGSLQEIRLFINSRDLRTRYLEVLEQCARAALDGDWLVLEVERLTALVSDAVREDPRKQFSNDAFDEAVAFLREFARRRPGFVLAAVAAARP